MREQRQYERAAFYCPLRLMALPDGPAVAGTAFDISVGGVGVVANVFLERGRTVHVHFRFSDESAEKPKKAFWGESPIRRPTKTAIASESSFWKPFESRSTRCCREN